MGHAFLAPSSAHIWGPSKGCRGFPLLAAGYASENDVDEADEGTAAHEWAAAALTGGGVVPDWLEKRASNGVLFDDDMQEAVQIYAEYVHGFTGPGAALSVERHQRCPSVHPEHNAGTPDAVIFQWPNLHVFDFKYGFGVVEAFENWQCLNYARAELDGLGLDGLQELEVQIHLHVIQPRAPHRDGPCRSWSLTGGDLRGYSNVLRTSAAECFHPDPVFRTGAHCRYCPARAVCKALQSDAASAADFSTRRQPDVALAGEAETELAILDDALRALTHRRDGLAEVVEHAARNGQATRYYGMAPKQSRKRWLVEPAEVYALGDAYQIDLRTDKPLTPPQAVKAGIPAEVVDAYAARPPAGLELKRDNGQTARKIFGGQNNGTN